MNYSHYLPDTPKRLKRFKRLVGGRPVAILVPGYSLYEFQDRIEDFKEFDICYASINKWLPLEQDILSKIDKRFSISMCGAAPDGFIEEICSYLDREDDNIFITERMNFKEAGGQNIIRLYDNYDKKLLFFTSFYPAQDRPSSDYPLHFIRENSLSILTALITIAEPSAIIYIGADGGRINKDEFYWQRVNEFTHADGLKYESSVERDTGWFNQHVLITLKLTRETHNVKQCEIINCSEKSYLTPFQKLSYNETIDYLRRKC